MGSIPGILGGEPPCHLIALNLAQSDLIPAPEASEDTWQALNQDPEAPWAPGDPGPQEHSSESDVLPLNADTLAFHSWSHSKQKVLGSLEALQVVFEPNSLEVRDMLIRFATKSRRKTLLSDCLIPRVLEELRHAERPPMVPFMFPKCISFALEARRTELKDTLIKGLKMQVLTLRDLRVRKMQTGSIGPRTMGRGTASHVSRRSLDDRLSEV